MPSPDELAQIIKEMRSQGLPDSEILETLQDMGVPEDLIRSALGSATAKKEPLSAPPQQDQPSPPPQPEQTTPSPPAGGGQAQSNDDLFAPSPAPKKDVLSELMTAGPSEAPAQTAPPTTPSPDVQQVTEPSVQPTPPKNDFSAGIATPPILEEESVPAEKLEEIHSKVDALHKVVTSSSNLRDDIAEVKEMLRELKRDMHEVKSMFSAIQHLLQQILETDRSILVDLYEKSKK